eukprot:185671_1
MSKLTWSTTILRKIEEGLEGYYQQFNRKDYRDDKGIGKLEAFCIENGFDDDQFTEKMGEFDQYSALLELDDFPLEERFEHCRETAILDILKYALKNGKPAPSSFVPSLQIDMSVSKAMKAKIMDAIQSIRLICPPADILNNTAPLVDGLYHFFSVGIANKMHLLLWLHDAYHLDALDTFVSHNTSLSLSQWVVSDRNRFTRDVSKRDSKKWDSLKSAMQQYSQILLPCVSLRPTNKIHDSVTNIVDYMCATSKFIKEALFINDRIATPCSIDLLFAVKKARIGDTDANNQDARRDCIGDMKERLTTCNVRYVAENLKDDCKYLYYPEYLSNLLVQLYNKLKPQSCNATFPQCQRLGIFVDRRTERDDIEVNEVIMFEHRKECGTIPAAHIAEWYQHLARKCIIPGSVKGIPTITAADHAHGQLMTLNFQIESVNETRCYLFWNGQSMRFKGEHLGELLSSIFVSTDDIDWKDVKKKKLLPFDEQITDYRFDIFRKQIGSAYKPYSESYQVSERALAPTLYHFKTRGAPTMASDDLLNAYLYAKGHQLYTHTDSDEKYDQTHDNASFSFWNVESDSLFDSVTKYQDLKQELLQNKVHQISMEQWDNVYGKAERLYANIHAHLGSNENLNTAFARYIPHLNDYYEIPYNTKMSQDHLLSILLCTDGGGLLSKIQSVHVQNKLYTEYTRWFRLLSCAISLYGTNLSQATSNPSDAVYVYLKEKVHFNQCMMYCNVPFTASKCLYLPDQLPQDTEVILELVGAQSHTAWAAPYFVTDSLSSENKCLFFTAQLLIKSVWYGGHWCDMSALSLYESILHGDVITTQDVSQLRTMPLTQTYPNLHQMLQHHEEKRGAIHINKQELDAKIHSAELKERLQQFTEMGLNEAEQFVWELKEIDVRQFITEETDRIVSKRMRSSAGSRFRCEMTVKEHKERRYRYGIISLNVFNLPSEQTISCQFYCKQMQDFYVRFDDVMIEMRGKKNNAKQIAFFEWERLENATHPIEWNIVIIHKEINFKRVRVRNEDEHNKKIMEIMDKHELDALNAERLLTKNESLRYLPLHRFDEDHVCAVIECWIFNDILFQEHLERIMNIFSDCSLSGERILAISMNNIQRELERELLRFVTPTALSIILRKINYWKTVDDEGITKKSEEEIAEILFKYPIERLLARVRNKNDVIDGEKCIRYYQERDKYEWIKHVTGWAQTEIYQIHSVLFKYASLTSSQIKAKMERVSERLEPRESDALRQCIDCRPDMLETIGYKIKNGFNELHEFSDKVRDVIAIFKFNDDKIKITYEAVADCFVTNYSKSTDKSEYELDVCPSWTCGNCSNYNFSNFINGKMNVDVSICSLCGMKQRDTVIMILKHYDTYTMVNSSAKTDKKATEKKEDDIDKLISDAMGDEFNLSCLKQSTNEPCPAMMRLARQLIIYKLWISQLSQKNDGSVKSTTSVDIARHVTNDQFKQIFAESMRSVMKQQDANQKLTNLLDGDTLNKDLAVFLSTRRKQFAAKIAQLLKVKIGPALRLHKRVLNSLKDKAQTEQFGKLCLDFDSGIIDEDYHHILESHIKNGDKTTTENAFRFFEKVVHFRDTNAQKKGCNSIDRMNETEIYANSDNQLNQKEITCEINRMIEDKDLWSSKQYYIQRQFDVMHSFLVHSNWEYFLNRYVKTAHDKQDSLASDVSDIDRAPSNQTLTFQRQLDLTKHKFFSDLQESSLNSNYGFGVDHQHPYLKPDHFCMRDELLYNTLHAMNVKSFRMLLTKALKKHHVALNHPAYKRDYVCKYYRKEFNLIRNQSIGIRHILTVVIYTDDSRFCTAFRKTYRKIDDEKEDYQVTQRHKQIYHYARNLYEAVELFGQRMRPTDEVYHGLNRVMFFHQFRAYFSQPMSTTKSKTIAHQFAGSEGKGVILTLKSGTEFENNVSKIPKYLSVSWISDYPGEEELLFYGDNVLFAIADITETKGNIHHQAHLLALNEFQNIVYNRVVDWNKSNKSKISAILCDFIQMQIKINESADRGFPNPNEPNYTQALFGYFCNHEKTTHIGINNYNSLPENLKMTLMTRVTKQKDIDHMTVTSLVHLFKHVKEIKFNNLNMQHMLQHGKKFVRAVLEYINSQSTFGIQLSKIIFQSEPQQERKPNPQLKQLESKNTEELNRKRWSISYHFDLTQTLTHCLTFKNNNETQKTANTKPTDDASTAPMPVMASSKCQWMPCLSYFMQVTEMTENRITLQIDSDVDSKKDRPLRVQQIMKDNELHQMGVDEEITILATEYYEVVDIEIDATRSKSYDLRLFDCTNGTDPLPNSNQLQFEVLQNKQDCPPHNTEYKPQAVDPSTVFAVKDETEDEVNVYWSLPFFSVGNIGYKLLIIDDNINEDDTKENEICMVETLPYRIPLRNIPKSFRIITETTVDDKTYASDPSPTIIVDDLNHSEVKPWDAFPHLLQILSVDADVIEIQFNLKQSSKQRTRCMVQSMDVNNPKWSQSLTMYKDNAKSATIDTKPDTDYTFAIFLNEAPVSNTISLRTPSIGFNPTTNYAPSPPSIESVTKYYDANKANILLLWDFPNLVFGDAIVYEVDSSNNKQHEEVLGLPYKVPFPVPQNMRIKLRTVSIVDGIRYPGTWSETVTL